MDHIPVLPVDFTFVIKPGKLGTVRSDRLMGQLTATNGAYHDINMIYTYVYILLYCIKLNYIIFFICYILYNLSHNRYHSVGNY
jgi:hypothetical protein